MKPLLKTVSAAARAIAAVTVLALPSLGTTADAPAGKSLFATRCGMCHQTNGMGVSILARRPGDASKGLLESREDLSAEFVYVVARMGTGNMPRISRAEVSDDELRGIALYLSRGKP